MLSDSLVFGYNFKEDQSLENLVTGNADVVNLARTAQFGEEGIILEGSSDDFRITMTDELGNDVEQGSMLIEFTSDKVDAGPVVNLLHIDSSVQPSSGLSLFDNAPQAAGTMFYRYYHSGSAEATFTIAWGSSADVIRRIAVRWSMSPLVDRTSCSFDGSVETEDTVVPVWDFLNQQIYIGSADIPALGGNPWGGTIARLYLYDVENGGDGTPDEWLQEIVDSAYTETQPVASDGGHYVRQQDLSEPVLPPKGEEFKTFSIAEVQEDGKATVDRWIQSQIDAMRAANPMEAPPGPAPRRRVRFRNL